MRMPRVRIRTLMIAVAAVAIACANRWSFIVDLLALVIVCLSFAMTAGLVSLGVYAAADGSAKAKAELKKLQGTWVEVYAEKAGEKETKGGEHAIRFANEAFSFWHDGRAEDGGTIKLGPSKNPMEIDLSFHDGMKAGMTALGIFAWAGDNLMFCFGEPGGGARPRDFTTTNMGRVLFVVKRQNP